MRRSFRGDPLYTQLFNSYLCAMSNRGHSLEYFIEGGRSRTGRLLPAKTGLLGITLQNHLLNPEKPVALVPVWISYDKLVESKSYRKELLGEEKTNESFLGLIKALKLFRHRFGDAALSFGEPLLLQQAVKEMPRNISSSGAKLKPTIHKLTQHISQQVLQRINQSTYANQTALLATLLLANPKSHHQTTELCSQTSALISLLKAMPNAPAAIAEGEVSHWIAQAAKRQQLSISEDNVFLSGTQAQEMTFYRNQLHHTTILPGLYLLLTKRYAKPLPQTLPRLLKTLYPYLQAELYLPWDKAELTTVFKQIRMRLEKRGLITRGGAMMEVSSSPLAVTLMQTAEPILLRYYIVFRLLSDGAAMTEADLISESQRIAANLHQKFGFNSPEYSDERALKIFIDTLISQSVFIVQQSPNQDLKQDMICCQAESASLIKRAKQILNPHYTDLIEQDLHPR